MEAIVKARMEGIKFGEIQIHGHVAVIPMISDERFRTGLPDHEGGAGKPVPDGHRSNGRGNTSRS